MKRKFTHWQCGCRRRCLGVGEGGFRWFPERPIEERLDQGDCFHRSVKSCQVRQGYSSYRCLLTVEEWNERYFATPWKCVFGFLVWEVLTLQKNFRFCEMFKNVAWFFRLDRVSGSSKIFKKAINKFSVLCIVWFINEICFYIFVFIILLFTEELVGISIKLNSTAICFYLDCRYIKRH